MRHVSFGAGSPAARLSVGFGFEVLVQLLVQPLVVLHAADVIQPPLTDLLTDDDRTRCQSDQFWSCAPGCGWQAASSLPQACNIAS